MEIAGSVKYADGIKRKKSNEFQKTIKYIKSVPIIIGKEHPEKFTLDDVVGYTDNFQVLDDKWTADYHFDPDKITDNNVKKAVLLGKNIPGSTWGFVKPVGDEHTAQVPIHMLVHPDLKPRIEGAGVVANAIKFEEEVPEMETKIYEEKIEKLESDLKASIAANAKLTEEKEALTVRLDAYRKEKVATLVANSLYTEDELKDKTFDEILLIENALSKRKGVDPLTLGGDDVKVPSLADRIKEANK